MGTIYPDPEGEKGATAVDELPDEFVKTADGCLRKCGADDWGEWERQCDNDFEEWQVRLRTTFTGHLHITEKVDRVALEHNGKVTVWHYRPMLGNARIVRVCNDTVDVVVEARY